MTSAYPFANNTRAQSDHAHPSAYSNDPDQRMYSYQDAPTGQGYTHQTNEWNQDGAYGDTDPTHGTDRNLTQGYAQGDYNEKSGAGVGSARDAGGAAAGYGFKERGGLGRFNGKNRDSVFSADDRHVFRRRSLPVRALRTIFCILIWAVIIVISVILLVVMYAKPPNVALLSVNVPTSNDFTVSGSSFSANGSLNFAISNPNSFSATINHLEANVYDAQLSQRVSIGNGTLKDQKIAANDNTTVVFPFDIGIDLSTSGQPLIVDVIQQCGIGSSSASGPQSLSVFIEVNARITILSVGVNIPISTNTSFTCPTAALESIIESLTGESTAAAAAAAIQSGLSRRGPSRPRGASEQKRNLLLLPTGEGVDWEVNRRELLRQVIQAWFPRGPQSSSDPTIEQVERRSLEL